MIQNLLILGKGCHAREMAVIVSRINAVQTGWHLLDPERVSPADRDYQVVSVHDYPEMPDIEPHRWATLIDPTCYIDPQARIASGCVLYPHCFVGNQARLDDRIFSLANTVINHHDVIERRVTLCSGVTLAGHVQVGRESYLGQGCNIRQHVRIGAGSLIGMGAVVLNDVQPRSVMVGNPATLLRTQPPSA